MDTITKINTRVRGKQIKQLGRIEKELLKFKQDAGFMAGKIVVSLRGMLKGIEFTEKDIREAKKSLFKF